MRYCRLMDDANTAPETLAAKANYDALLAAFYVVAEADASAQARYVDGAIEWDARAEAAAELDLDEVQEPQVFVP